MNYAGFWRRLAATQVDVLILSPPILLAWRLTSDSKALALALEVPLAAFAPAYAVYFHGRFGQTPGKRIAGIRVLQLDGSAVGWRAAWLRASVDIVFAVLGATATLLALSRISDADYYSLSWQVRLANIAANEPAWLRWVPIAGQVWVWSEVVVMLFNRQRRALHDFIAGTVVVNERTVSGAVVAVVVVAAMIATGLLFQFAV